MGYPLADILGENKPSITQGIVSKDTGMNDDPGFFQLTAKLNSGNSGGPIFTEEGNIIGIAVMKLDKTLMLQEDGTIPEDVNFGIPSTRIERLTGYSSDEIFTQDLDLEKLYEALIPSVVMVLNILDAQE
jgi:S1-C subfamily serine protease